MQLETGSLTYRELACLKALKFNCRFSPGLLFYSAGYGIDGVSLRLVRDAARPCVGHRRTRMERGASGTSTRKVEHLMR